MCDTCTYRHSLCRDVDWLANLEVRRLDPDFHLQMWLYFLHPSLLNDLPSEEAEKYRATFERCRRIWDKKESIWAEIRSNQERMMRDQGFPLPDEKVFGDVGCWGPEKAYRRAGPSSVQ